MVVVEKAIRAFRGATTRVSITVLFVVGLGLVILTGTGHDRAEVPLPVFGTHSASAAAETADAVFASIELPPGARPISHLSANRLAIIGYYGAAQASGVVRVGIWQLPMSIDQAATFIEHHLPPGLPYEEAGVDVVPNELGTFGGTVSFTSRLNVGPVNATTPFTRVSYSLTAATGDRPPTDVVVGVDAVLEPPRTAAEELPAGTTTVQITRTGFYLGKVEKVVSTRSVTSASATVIARFAAIIGRLQPFLLGLSASCFSPNITTSTILDRYRLVFSGGGRSLTIDYRYCGYVGVTADGHAQPPLDDAPRKNGLVASEPLSNEIESVFSPGVPLIWFGYPA